MQAAENSICAPSSCIWLWCLYNTRFHPCLFCNKCQVAHILYKRHDGEKCCKFNALYCTTIPVLYKCIICIQLCNSNFAQLWLFQKWKILLAMPPVGHLIAYNEHNQANELYNNHERIMYACNSNTKSLSGLLSVIRWSRS